MPNGYFTHPLIFIIEIVFGLYLGLLALRLIMRWTAWDPSHPASQFILKFTHPPIALIRRFLPHPLKTIANWDTATIILLIAISAIKVTLISLLKGQIFFSLIPLSFLTLAAIFTLFISLFTASIIIGVILSWLGPQGIQNPFAPLVYKMNVPLLTPIRRSLPLIAGIDFSPLIGLLGLQLLSMLVLPLLITT